MVGLTGTSENKSNNFKGYRKRKPLEERIKIAKSVLKKFSNHIPLIIEDSKGETIKTITPLNVTVGHLVASLRLCKKIHESKAIFFFTDTSRMLRVSDSINELYSRYKDPLDNILYLTLHEETTFGKR
jgi:Microtubule associated protein 1A/1B, light chain 3.